MLDPEGFQLFLATAVVLVLSPGPDTLLVLSRTLASGTGAGLLTLLGTQTGNVVHSVLAGVGVSTLVLAFPSAWMALKAAGVAYLLWLAVQAWRAAGHATLSAPPPAGAGGAGGAGRFFLQGLFNNLANPKMIAFFLALFPQFIRPDQGSVAAQSLLLGATLAGMAVLWIGAMTLVAGRFRSVVAADPRFLRLANRLAAATFAGLALRLAVQRQT